MATLEIEGAGKTDLHLIPPEHLVVIGLDTKDGPEHPLFDERVSLPIDPAMVKNVCHFGIMENVVVCRDGKRFLVIAGRQRVRWAREANKILAKEGATLLRVPTVLRGGTEKERFGLMITENECRQDDEILTKAAKCSRFIAMGNTEADASLAFGVTLQQVKNWLLLCDVSAPVKKAVESGKISASAAIKLAPLAAADQKTKLEEILKDATEGKKVSVSKVEAKIGKKKKKRKKEDDKPTTEQLESIFEHLDALNAKKRLTGKTEGLFDAVAWVLGKLATEEMSHLYEETAEILEPEEKKKSA